MKPSGTIPSSVTAGQHTVMFWALTLPALLLFAPCVLLPIWVESEEILEHEATAAAMVSDLQTQIEQNESRIQALETDPLVNDRIARRELNYRPQDERVVAYSPAELAAFRPVFPPCSAEQAISPQDPRPAWMVSACEWLPAWPWRKLFVESPNRLLMLAMAGGLLITAFVLYGPIASNGRLKRG